MQLSPEQTARFERDGYVFLPEVFSGAEIALLHAEAARIYASARPEVVREKDGATARTAFAAHTFSEPFRRLAAHPRLIGPVEQLLGGGVEEGEPPPGVHRQEPRGHGLQHPGRAVLRLPGSLDLLGAGVEHRLHRLRGRVRRRRVRCRSRR